MRRLSVPATLTYRVCPAPFPFAEPEISLSQRMAAKWAATVAFRQPVQGRLRAVLVCAVRLIGENAAVDLSAAASPH